MQLDGSSSSADVAVEGHKSGWLAVNLAVNQSLQSKDAAPMTLATRRSGAAGHRSSPWCALVAVAAVALSRNRYRKQAEVAVQAVSDDPWCLWKRNERIGLGSTGRLATPVR